MSKAIHHMAIGYNIDMIDFDAIKTHAMANINGLLQAWLPGGKIDKNQYVVLNPKRNDKTPGSFSVNLTTGAFNDFADPSCKGGDLIALYAWLHGLKQSEAAKEVAQQLGIMEGDCLKRDLPKVVPITDAPAKPRLDPVFPAPFEAPEEVLNNSRIGRPDSVYRYLSKTGELLGYVCRFNKPGGGKDVKPLFWFGEKQWLWKGPSGDFPRPIYGLEQLNARPDAPVLIVEGEKAADAGRRLLLDYVVLSWLGGTGTVKRVPWGLLAGRQVTIWPDNDAVGLKAAKTIQEAIEGSKIVVLPPDLKPAFDVADCATPDEASEILAYESRAKLEAMQPDKGSGFKYLGLQQHNGKVYYLIYDYDSQLVHRYTASSITWDALQELGPPEFWNLKYMGMESKRAKTDAARQEIIGSCKRLGLFDESRIRGRGVWVDDKRTVAHVGRSVWVDGRERELYQIESRYVYRQKAKINLTGKPIHADDGVDFLALCQLLSWETPSAAYLLAGWVFLAPVCGALRWRPHLWITGQAGSGKSWVYDEIISRILDNFSVRVQGETTEAGLRQQLANDALPVIFDEAESETNRSEGRIQNILALMRQASSNNSAAIIKGTATGEAMHYSIRSMFAFVSILSGVVQTSDATRVSVINLLRHSDDPIKAEAHFAAVNATLQAILTPEFINGIKLRAIEKLPLILEAVEMFSKYAAIELRSKRLGDQIGTLLAGTWVLTNDTLPTPEQVQEFMSVEDWSAYVAKNEGVTTDHDKALAFLLQSTIRHGMEEVSIGELIQRSQNHGYNEGKDAESTRSTLSRWGFYVKDGFLRVAHTNPQLKKLFKETPWRGKWTETLGNLPGTLKSTKNWYMGAGHFPTRCLLIPMSLVKLGGYSDDN